MACAIALSGCAERAMTPDRAAGGSWYEIRTAHLRAWSDGNLEVARRLLAELESFHQLMVEQAVAVDESLVAPVHIVLLGSNRSMQTVSSGWPAIGRDPQSALLHGTVLRDYILLDTTAWDLAGTRHGYELARKSLFMLYATHLLKASPAKPWWYQRGLSEYAAGTVLKPDGTYIWGCERCSAWRPTIPSSLRWRGTTTACAPDSSRRQAAPMRRPR
jgi:hypothetical protein